MVGDSSIDCEVLDLHVSLYIVDYLVSVLPGGLLLIPHIETCLVYEDQLLLRLPGLN